MTGAGAPGGPGVIKCLLKDKNIDLLVCDINPEASGRFLHKQFVQIPPATDNDFITQIFQICEEEKIDVIFPLVTRELFKFSKEKAKFEKKGIKVIVSDYESLQIANNKSSLCKHLYNNNIPTPKFEIVSNYNELLESMKVLGFPNQPLCIKPSISNGSRGVRIIDDSIDEFDLLFNHKPNSLYMSFEKLKSILKSTDFPELLVSEVLPGSEYSIDTIVSNGNILIILPRKRNKINAGISVAGKFEKNIEIIEYCKKIINSLKLSGPIGIQVKKSKNGDYKILEINPRIQGTSIAALGAGINLPLLSVYSTLGMDINISKINWDAKFVRYYNEVFYG
jgi:carbamoyl-phosphate synthase large subunit